MKKILSLLMVCIFAVSLLTMPVYADDDITVIVNGEKLISDVPAQALPVYNEAGEYLGDRTMLPIRAISEKLNCDVYWDADEQGITLYRKNNLYIMWVGKEMAFHLNGPALEKGYEMDVPPTIIDSRTLIPVRAVGEILGAKVEWIGETRTVDIKYDLGEIESNKGTAEQCKIYATLLLEQYGIYTGYIHGTIKTVNGKFVLASGEEIKFELYPEIAPETCERFITLANNGYYNDTIFHRVIEDFVAQGGGADINGEFKPKGMDYINGEFIMNGYFNLISHRRGTISMARAEDKNSATGQFFIVHKDSLNLDGNYAAFGRVTEGMDVVDKICTSETDANDVPTTPIVVKEVVIFK